MDDEKRIAWQEGCARCDGPGHHDLVFRKFKQPVVAGEYVFSYWTFCPTTGEPIMLMVTEDDE